MLLCSVAMRMGQGAFLSALVVAACWASGCGSVSGVHADGGTDAQSSGLGGHSGAGAGGNGPAAGAGGHDGVGGAAGAAIGGAAGGASGSGGPGGGAPGGSGGGGGITSVGSGGGGGTATHTGGAGGISPGTGGAAAGGQSGSAGGKAGSTAGQAGSMGGQSAGGQSGAAGGVGGQAGSGAGGSTSCASDSSCPTGKFCDTSRTCSAGVVDQQALLWGANGPLGGTSAQKVAQIVTAGAAGKLVEVRLAVECLVGSSITVEIQSVASDGSPSGTVLSTVTLQPPPATGNALPLVGIPLTTPVNQTVGMQLAIAAFGPATNSCAISFGPSSGGYLGGPLFVDVLPNAPGWAEMPGYILFQTVVGP